MSEFTDGPLRFQPGTRTTSLLRFALRQSFPLHDPKALLLGLRSANAAITPEPLPDDEIEALTRGLYRLALGKDVA